MIPTISIDGRRRGWIYLPNIRNETCSSCSSMMVLMYVMHRIVKNSWSTKFGNQGFIKLARGYKDETHETGGCAHIACCGWVPCYGDCPTSE
jgi:hypothetical protein